MKTIDIKSLLIGALLTSTIFLGVAALANNAGVQEVKIVSIDEGFLPWEAIKIKQ
jgi:hypothetical protein|tara:strand:- start:500 stop:664 length:165 start_codon:yes stop_codon:yes gene_type:complete